MSQNDKIVTVEEVPELSPPVTNWTQLNSRESFNFGDGPSGDISLFDLIKVSLRYRPDYVIVGEIRGEEAYVLFQALATGHGGLCTMHADSIDRVVKRLTSPPMNVSEVYIPLMNIALYIQRVELPDRRNGVSFGRRVRTVSEIAEYENYIDVCRWDPRKDEFNTWFDNSFILGQISAQSGLTIEQLLKEIDKREQYLKDLVLSKPENQSVVAERVLAYKARSWEKPQEESSTEASTGDSDEDSGESTQTGDQQAGEDEAVDSLEEPFQADEGDDSSSPVIQDLPPDEGNYSMVEETPQE